MNAETILQIITDYTIGDFLSLIIINGGKEFMLENFNELGLNMKSLVHMSLYISLVIYGIKFILGDLASSGKDVLITIVWVVIGLQVTNATFYNSFIFDTVFEIKGNLTSVLMYGNSKYSVYQSFSLANSAMFEHAFNLLDSAGISDVSVWISALAIFIIYGFYYIEFIAITVYADLVLVVLMLLGAIVIPLSGFKSLRGLFKSWIVAITKYVAVFVIVAMIVSILNSVSTLMVEGLIGMTYEDGSITKGGYSDPTEATNLLLAGVLIIGCFGAYLIFQAMEFAAELTGGVMSGTSGTGALRGSMAGVGSAIKTSNNTIGGGVGKRLGSVASNGVKSIGGQAWKSARGIK